MPCQCTIENHLASCQRYGFCTWVNSSEISLPRVCLFPLLSCLPPTRGNLGLLEALTWTDPLAGKFSVAWRQFSLPATLAHCLPLTLVPGTGLGTQEPRISISTVSCLSLKPQSRSQASVSNHQTKDSKHVWDRDFSSQKSVSHLPRQLSVRM